MLCVPIYVLLTLPSPGEGGKQLEVVSPLQLLLLHTHPGDDQRPPPIAAGTAAVRTSQ